MRYIRRKIAPHCILPVVLSPLIAELLCYLHILRFYSVYKRLQLGINAVALRILKVNCIDRCGNGLGNMH